MSEPTPTRRVIEITAGNLRQNHLYVNRHYDFFPADIVGGPRRDGAGGQIESELDGLKETVATDIAANAQTGKPRGFLRCRGPLRRFFEHHQVQPGGQVCSSGLPSGATSCRWSRRRPHPRGRSAADVEGVGSLFRR